MAYRQRFLGALLGSVSFLALSFPALADDPPAPQPSEPGASDSAKPAENNGPIERVVVTAQKRSEQLRDVPQSVTAVTEKTLERQQMNSLTDYAVLVPGMQTDTSQPGYSRVILRGINSGGVGATIGVYLDETPYGSSSALANGLIAPDVDTFDLSRIEVLRGPQGTLYGASTLGGLLKFVTNAPDPSGFEAKIAGGLEVVDHGGVGYSAQGMINVPLADDLALRAIASTRLDAGYVDDPFRGIEDINDATTTSYRASMLWEPSSDLSVRLTALGQNIDSDNSSAVNLVLSGPVTVALPLRPLYGDLEQAYSYDQPVDTKYRQYSGALDYNLGFADLTSVTSFNTFELSQLVEYTLAYGVPLTTDINVDKFVQEVRLASPASDKFEWLLGFFYTDEDTAYHQALVGIGPVTLDSKFKETAGFANATYHFSPAFDLAFGGRYSVNEQSLVQAGIAGAAAGDSSEDVFTYAVAPRWHVDDDTMVYGRVAKGYRPGGPNATPPVPPPGFPSTFGSDSLINYELGLKSDVSERMSLDISAFFIDWSDIQLLTVYGGYGVNGNGGTAESKGVEWTINFVPVDDLVVLFTGAYTDTQLTEDTDPVVGGFKGEALPNAAKWATALSADYSFPGIAGSTAYVGGTWSYVGDRAGGFDAAFGRIELPSYNTVDLRGGFDWERWSLQLYVKNVGDERGIMSTGRSYAPLADPVNSIAGLNAAVIQPRTVGLAVTGRF